MQNGLPSQAQTPQTGNPQGSAPSTGASEGADFQQTAPSDVLSQQAQTRLVDANAPIGDQPAATGSWDFAWWGLGLLLVLILAGMYLIRLLGDRDEPAAEQVSPQKQVEAPAVSAPKPARKKTASGKPVKKRKKKPTRKRR